jgi:starch synthase
MSNVECKGTGFVFEKYKASEMLKEIKHALKIYKNKKIWHQLIINAMTQDFSWNVSAKKYLQLYKKVLNK